MKAGRAAWGLVSGVMLLGLGACATLTGVDPHRGSGLELAWGVELYGLGPLPYHPKEEGRALFVRSEATPKAGLVVVPTKDREVRGLDAADGRVVWSLTTRGPNVARPLNLAVAGAPDELLVASLDGHVYRVGQRNGRASWVSEAPGAPGITATPAVAAERVFVTSLDNRLTALSLVTGQKLWDYQRPLALALSVSGQGGATVVGDQVVAGFADGTLVSLAQADGSVTWTADLARGAQRFADIETTPVWVPGEAGGLVVAASFMGGLAAVRAQDGTAVWRREGEGFLTPAFDEGVLYVPQASGALWAVEAESGRVRWVSRFGTGACGTPAVSRKYIFAPVGEGLAVLDRGSGRELARWSDGRGVSAPPELAYGTLFVIANSGFAYGLAVY